MIFIDIDCVQQKKTGMNACGDAFQCRRNPNDDRVIAVLSDGLGSGVKANILALMTATMLVRFVEQRIPIRKAAEIMMNSLPIDKVRHISYATYSMFESSYDGDVHIIEEGNPDFVWLRGTQVMEPECREIPSTSFPNRRLKFYHFPARLGDRIIFCSDGVTQAGMGKKEYRVGWERRRLIEFLQEQISACPDISSRDLATKVVEKAVSIEPGGRAGDDISLCAIYFREPRKSLVFTGAPYNADMDGEYARQFDAFEGKKAICGGTTCNIIARELERPVTMAPLYRKSTVPPTFKMEGVDLVTEGVLTLNKTLQYLTEGHSDPLDAAGQLMSFFLESDMIEFMLGAKLNQSNYDPSLPVQMELRRDIVQKLAKVLQEKYMKYVKVRHI